MIAITMRMMVFRYESGVTETRDAIAHDWWRFLTQALPDVPIMPLPNIGTRVTELLKSKPTGLILSGGDDWGVFPERDATEKVLLNWTAEYGVPVLGVCRGAQVLNLLGGGTISPAVCSRHVGTRHIINFVDGKGTRVVNSWHENVITGPGLAPGFRPVAWAEDGSVEAFSGDNGRITGIVWHPERERTPDVQDVSLFKNWK